MELTEQDKQVLKATVELLWKKGTNHPQEAEIGVLFTRFVEKVLKPEEKAPMVQNTPEKLKKV